MWELNEGGERKVRFEGTGVIEFCKCNKEFEYCFFYN